MFSGLGQRSSPVVVPAELVRDLERAESRIKMGITEWTNLQRIDRMTEGDELLSRAMTIRRQLFSWGVGDLPELRTLIPLFAVEAENYFSAAKQAGRKALLSEARARGDWVETISQSGFELPELSELPLWMWVAGGAGLYLLLRR